jgi:hypothetical protein
VWDPYKLNETLEVRQSSHRQLRQNARCGREGIEQTVVGQGGRGRSRKLAEPNALRVWSQWMIATSSAVAALFASRIASYSPTKVQIAAPGGRSTRPRHANHECKRNDSSLEIVNSDGLHDWLMRFLWKATAVVSFFLRIKRMGWGTVGSPESRMNLPSTLRIFCSDDQSQSQINTNPGSRCVQMQAYEKSENGHPIQEFLQIFPRLN